MKIKGSAAVIILILSVLVGCKQAASGLADVSTNKAAQTKADAALAAAQAALGNAYANNGTSTPASGLSVTGSSSLSGAVYTFDETVTATDYDPNETGITATDDFVLKGTLTPGGAGQYTLTADVILGGTVASGHVLLDLSLTTDGSTVTYNGKATVSGFTYDYSGQTTP